MKRVITGQKRYRHAFTFIELVIVLGIISLVLVVTVPRLGGIYDRVLVEEQTRIVEQDLLWLRSEARRTGVATVFRCNGANGYTMTVVENDESKAENRPFVSERVSMSSNARYGLVVFQARGTAFEKCTLTFSAGKEKRIIVVNNLGRIRVGRGNG